MNVSDFSYDWANSPSHLILEGAANDGTPLLKMMLSDYVKLTGEKVNAGCPTCLKNYITHLKKYIDMQNTPETEKKDYKLHAKRIPMTLDFGSDIMITNENLTNELALKLVDKFLKLGVSEEEVNDFLFSKHPNEDLPGYKDIVAKKEKPTKIKTKPVKKDSEKNTEEIEVVSPVIETGGEEEIEVTTNDNEDIIDLDFE